MKKTMLYELVNAKVRDSFDLTTVEDIIRESIAFTYPEATNVSVFASFYCFASPEFSDKEKNRRARSLGRMLARKMPELTRLAIRTYESQKHAKSNQLFKVVKGKKRLKDCLGLLFCSN